MTIKSMGAVFVAMALLFSGCSTEKQVQVPTPSPVNENAVFKMLLADEPKDLDPGTSVEIYAEPIIHHNFEGLVRNGPGGTILPGVAESWKMSQGGKTYVFKLRKNAKWSDGKPVTASDFQYAWLRILNAKLNSQNASYLTPYILNAEAFFKGTISADQVGIKVVDPLTLQVELKNPTPYFIQLLTYWAFNPVRKDNVEGNGDKWAASPEHYIGNGPFRTVEYEQGTKIVLQRSPTYWNSSAVKLSGLQFTFAKNMGSEEAFEAFRNKSVDCIQTVSPVEAKAHADIYPYVNITPSFGTAFFYLNHNNPLVKKLEFRKALSLSLDRKKLVEEQLLGGGIPTSHLIPPNMKLGSYTYSELDPTGGGTNLEKAKDLIKQAGLTGKEVIRVGYMDSPIEGHVVPAIIAEWESELGIKIVAEKMPWKDLFDKALKGDYDILFMGFTGDFPHPMTFLDAFNENGMAGKLLRWDSTEYQKVLDGVMVEEDLGKSIELMHRAENILTDEAHIIPVYHRESVCVITERLKNWHRDIMSYFDFYDAWME